MTAETSGDQAAPSQLPCAKTEEVRMLGASPSASPRCSAALKRIFVCSPGVPQSWSLSLCLLSGSHDHKYQWQCAGMVRGHVPPRGASLPPICAAHTFTSEL